MQVRIKVVFDAKELKLKANHNIWDIDPNYGGDAKELKLKANHNYCCYL